MFTVGELFDALPFHICLDRELRLIHCGEALGRIVPTLATGAKFFSLFRISSPRSLDSFPKLCRQNRSLVLLETITSPPLILRCLLLVDNQQERLLFMASPWVTDVKQLDELGLCFSDLPANDPLLDYLLLLHTSRAALEDSQGLASQLQEQMQLVESKNKSLLRLSDRLMNESVEREMAERRLNEAQERLLNLNRSLEQRVQERMQQLAVSELRYHDLVDSVPDAVFICSDNHLIYLNAAAAQLLGAESVDSLLNNSIFDHVPDQYWSYLSEKLDYTLQQHQKTSISGVHIQPIRGALCEIEAQAVPIFYQDKHAVLIIAHDLTERRRHETELEFQATHDMLTSLPNRALFVDRLKQAIAHAERSETHVAVIYVDLDNFKLFNDSLGHEIGDQLLCRIAERMQSCMREEDTCARVGGDEFVVLVANIEKDSIPVQVAHRLLNAIAQPLTLADQQYTLTASMGISVFPTDGTDPDLLVQHADIAMFRAKEESRNTYRFFTPLMQQRVTERLSLEKQLRLALDRDELVLYYQPKVELAHGRLVGMEALIRWNSPEHGLLSPHRFIPVAEESDLIIAIGEWVLQTAVAQNSEWQRSGLPIVPTAINVASSQFFLHRIDQHVQQALTQSKLDACFLELELTETMSMQYPEESIRQMRLLKELGVGLTIDDFGTGYSNLTYLRYFPIDKLKLDKTFVCGLTHYAGDRAIASALIQLAHSLDLKVVAEGVETLEQLKYLLAHDCDEMQGYYYSMPIPAAEAAKLLSHPPRLRTANVAA